MYDELVKRLWECVSGECWNCSQHKDSYDGQRTCADNLMKQAADAIEKLQKPKWIPVTERLPEDLKLVLAVEDGIVFIAHCAHYYGEEEVFVEWHDTMHYPVSPTHWMPLPSDPTEE